MVVATVKGRSARSKALIEATKPTRWRRRDGASIDVGSIDTSGRSATRTCGPTTFSTPRSSRRSAFVSKGERVDAENYGVVGDLTIRDVTKRVVLDTEFEGQIQDPLASSAPPSPRTTADQPQGLRPQLERRHRGGGVVVSDKVKITLHISAVRQD